MQKTSFLAALVLAITGPAIFAAGQEWTKASLFLGPSEDLTDSANAIVLKPLNETSGDKEMVCMGALCCTHCLPIRARRLEEVLDEHRRLQVTGKSQVQEIACFDQPWGLQAPSPDDTARWQDPIPVPIQAPVPMPISTLSSWSRSPANDQARRVHWRQQSSTRQRQWTSGTRQQRGLAGGTQQHRGLAAGKQQQQLLEQQ
ncbi:hypothetical protein PHYSODRAFT_327647 [Phytophthora sojae]|uniref:Uncharacterized protein n=1 Tax=Phytophthora sojae (strain P6497) TaxID=1094619 RepID=G4Z3K6_PHYSP|nr:hypothetical protein PHYSODRAFT_327647 [Phytophthora sojae]EGZ19378.1 hypothetical protein PHYSODRAFT_327647 [Phytophthora sojae]|eukprot:XP_009522095.1 hypothetical protein PHYSODRAFT_327647 [Phytophthora sojae]